MTNKNQNLKLFTPINIATVVAVLALHGYIASALANMQVQQLKVPEIKETAPIEIQLIKSIGQKTPQQPEPQPPAVQQPKVESKPKPKPVTKPKAEPKPKPAAKPKPVAKPKPKPKPITEPKPKPKPKDEPKPITAAKPVVTVDEKMQQQRQWEIEQQLEAERKAKLKAELEAKQKAEREAARKRAEDEARARAEANARARDAAASAKAAANRSSGGGSNKAQTFSASDASWKREPNFNSLASIRTNARSGDVLNFTIKLTVDKQGNVTRAQVVKSSGYPRLDKAAERIAKKGKLNPFKNGNGDALLGNVTLPFNYRIN